jgi:tRNA threonylcarbamoyladenosine biosynthesis protein TsaE
VSHLLHLPTEVQTQALGGAAARCLPREPQPFVIELVGDLGAGKTTFARGLLQALGVVGRVRSPSYGLLEHYELAGWQVLHLDLYRLLDPEELENLGVRDYHAGRSLWLVEWPEKGQGYLPAPDARLTLSCGADGHRAELAALSGPGQAWLTCLMKDRTS